MEFFVKIFGTTVWKSIGGCSDFNYYYSPCYQYCVWDFINARYYDPNDVDNLKHIDKIAVTYLGLRNESFVNRCHVNVTAVDNNNLPLSGVRVLDSEDSLTNNEGLFSFPVFTSGGVAVNIIGILPGYICTSGCGVIPILEATSDKDIIITLTKCEQPICNMIIGD